MGPKWSYLPDATLALDSWLNVDAILKKVVKDDVRVSVQDSYVLSFANAKEQKVNVINSTDN